MTTSAYSRLSRSRLPLVLPGRFGPASAHDAPTGWKYPWPRFSEMKCHKEQSLALLEKPQGYVMQFIGEVVGYGETRINDSPYGEYHWRAHQAGLDAGHRSASSYRPGAREAASTAADDVRSSQSIAIENSVNQARWILVPLFAFWIAFVAVGAILF